MEDTHEVTKSSTSWTLRGMTLDKACNVQSFIGCSPSLMSFGRLLLISAYRVFKNSQCHFSLSALSVIKAFLCAHDFILFHSTSKPHLTEIISSYKDQDLKRNRTEILSSFSISHGAVVKSKVASFCFFKCRCLTLTRSTQVSEPYPHAASSLTDGVSGSTASWSLWITNKDKHRFIWCLLRYVRSHITQSCRYPCREIEDSMNQKAEKGLETWRIQVSSWGWNKHRFIKKQKQACNWPKVKRIIEEHIHKPSRHPKDLSKAFSFDMPFHPLIVRLFFLV